MIMRRTKTSKQPPTMIASTRLSCKKQPSGQSTNLPSACLRITISLHHVGGVGEGTKGGAGGEKGDGGGEGGEGGEGGAGGIDGGEGGEGGGASHVEMVPPLMTTG